MIQYNNTEKKILDTIYKASNDLKLNSYLIGGYVRDKILKRKIVDIDVVCIGDGILLAKKTAEYLGLKKKVTIFKRFGTAMIKYKGLDIEFVGARKESYDFKSRKPVVKPGTFIDDLKRRDFTINTFAISINDKSFDEIIDVFGGLRHLEEKLIKTPLDPDKTFSDDPLRMMRAIRFATQLNFNIEENTFESIKNNKERIKIVSIERITTELQKIVASKIPSTGFKYLFDSGLLEIIFPEMAQLYGVETIDGKSHKDNFYHTIQVLDNVAEKTDNIWLRWAAIMHDIAKPKTKKFTENEGWTFHGHEIVGYNMTYHIFKRMRLPLDNHMKFVQKLVKLHLRPMALVKEEVTDSAIRRLLYEAGDDIDALMLLAKADITSKNERKIKTFLKNYDKVIIKLKEVEQKDKLRNWQPPITGEEIMKTFGLKPSKTVGIIKTEIREAILDGKISNDFEQAYAYMLETGQKMGLNPVK
jgi:tRNA nucleotidyltransferase/poly(A) polymerase